MRSHLKKDLSLSKLFLFYLSWNGSFHSFLSFLGLVILFFAILFQFCHLSTFLNPFLVFDGPKFGQFGTGFERKST